jgi:hypothetical protein
MSHIQKPLAVQSIDSAARPLDEKLNLRHGGLYFGQAGQNWRIEQSDSLQLEACPRKLESADLVPA